MTEVHICPILMRTVVWEDGICVEDCHEPDCSIRILIEQKSRGEV